uniref:Uncharacterized protein n=1 Tax=Anguilla anguilla TaxID=7936 RepID=A0A0E9U4I5_ANGAN
MPQRTNICTLCKCNAQIVYKIIVMYLFLFYLFLSAKLALKAIRDCVVL